MIETVTFTENGEVVAHGFSTPRGFVTVPVVEADREALLDLLFSL